MKNIHNPKSEKIIEGLMDFLTETGEENLLLEVSEGLDKITKKTKDAKEILILSAELIDKAQLNKITKIINEYLGVEIPVINKIDNQVLGGFKVQVGDWFLDASLERQLKEVKQSLLK